MLQTTVKEIIEFSGIGLHTGLLVKTRILPAPADAGIRFIRRDVPGSPAIKARGKNVIETLYAMTLGKDGVTVSTVEHLLAAFYGLRVDNAVVEVFGPEIPIMDGSAAPFVEMIEGTGLRKLNAPRRYLVVKKPMKIAEGDKSISLLPPKDDAGLTIEYTIDFSHPYLNRQSFAISLCPRVFKEEVVKARTFGFLRDVEMLRKNGLARGGSLENAVVIGDRDVLNEEGLRFPDEFVRHKVLDLIGDISLLGVQVIGRIKAHRSGHSLNYGIVKKALSNPGRWKVTEFAEEELPAASAVFEGEFAPA
ncbi:MAG: UDP-3-O-acyl-N-acetylglucosamine deacetylase [Deltaproteobacteria bacterium]|nr:UDP-3-O-acyl-N-acetylglucosamine deacetylase [Deltaproteobacteria bacterium]